MNVIWFVSDISKQNGQLYSTLASVRLRCIEPLRGLGQIGDKLNVQLCAIGPNMQLDLARLASCDSAIIGKTTADLTPLLNLLDQHNVPIVVDICDDPYEKDHLRSTYETLIRRADLITAASDYLAGKIRDQSGKDVVVIDDVMEYAPVPAAARPKPAHTIRLCWFGQASNLVALVEQLPQLAQLGFDSINIDVITNLVPELVTQLGDAARSHSNLEVNVQAWSIEAVGRTVPLADAVLIPVAGHEWAKSKTANRVMTAIQLGRPCVAGVIPSYEEFAEFAVLAPDLLSGITRLLADWDAQPERIRRGQDYIAGKYSAAHIAQDWLALIRKSSSLRPEKAKRTIAAPGISRSAIRLNLGCGDKILPGYINVDLVDERAGKKPDVMCDIRLLTVFEDNYADEVLTVHVIEHFYYWEAQKVLREWVRVLKPGGRMIIECPNLLTACQEVVKSPETAVRPGREGQRTMWVFYGDPAWKDPLMCHKWLYTPASLRELMEECGLVDVRQEPAQFKLREPRDMRMVGIKKQ